MLTPADNFKQLLNDDWDFRMRENPIMATRTGDHRFNDQMPDVSEGAAQRKLVQLKNFQQQAENINRIDLQDADRINYDIYIRLLENEIKELEFRGYRYPISKVFGVQNFLPSLQITSPFSTTQDYENYIARLNGIKLFIDQIIEVMRAGLDDGQILPRVAVDGVEESIASQIVSDPSASVSIRPFNNFSANVPEQDHERLTNAAMAAVTTSIVPAYKSLLTFINNEYLPGSRETIGAYDLPDGKSYYAFCIKKFTSLPLSAEEIYKTGQNEVKRIRSEMESVIQTTGFDGDFKAFVKFLRTDPRFYVETPEELLKETGYLLKRIDGELPSLFQTLPRLPYGLKEIPDYAAPGATTAYYMSGSGDQTIAGFYYVNTYDLKSRPLYELESLSLHEAVPGHHLQIALQQELDLPNFRRFGGFTSFTEGWALYSERLGLEMGFFTDPYSNFGRLSYEMWRACRLVVDTGMHALGWTRQQAIDFMLDNTSSTELNIINEIDRYISWPGQALAYKIGEIKIRELRSRSEEKLGADFNIRQFHDVILSNGAVPLDILEEIVDDWITTFSVSSGQN